MAGLDRSKTFYSAVFRFFICLFLISRLRPIFVTSRFSDRDSEA